MVTTRSKTKAVRSPDRSKTKAVRSPDRSKTKAIRSPDRSKTKGIRSPESPPIYSRSIDSSMAALSLSGTTPTKKPDAAALKHGKVPASQRTVVIQSQRTQIEFNNSLCPTTSITEARETACTSPLMENVEGKKPNPSGPPQLYLPTKPICIIVSSTGKSTETKEFFLHDDGRILPEAWSRGSFSRTEDESEVLFVAAQKSTVIGTSTDGSEPLSVELQKGGSFKIRSDYRIRVGRAECKISIVPIAPARMEDDEVDFSWEA